MAEFRYEAVDSEGTRMRGKLLASDAVAARIALRNRALLPISVEPVSKEAAPAGAMKHAGVQPTLSAAVLSRITRQLCTLIANNIRVEDALATIARQGLHPKTAKSLTDVRKLIVDGQSFAAALASQGRRFPKPYIAAIAAGEASGRLDIVLQNLAQHTETTSANQRTVTYALIYPVFLAIVSALIITLLITQVVPDILGVYQRRGTQLPLSTQSLIWISGGLRSAGPGLLVAVIGVVASLRWAVSTVRGGKFVAQRALRLPGIGAFLKQRHAAQIASTLSILVQSGVPLVRGLKISADVLSNSHVRDLVQQAATETGDGAPLDAALARTGIFPEMMLSMIAGGIRSGDLGSVLAWAGRDQQAALDQKLKAFSALLEPVVLLVMGGMILFIVMAILTPITRLNTLAGG